MSSSAFDKRQLRSAPLDAELDAGATSLDNIPLMNRNFWQEDSVHLALPPGGEAAGLAEYAAQLGLGGCCLFQTSGSEGRPKWVLLTKRAMLASARAVNMHLAAGNADRWLIALPQWHVGGFSIWARAAAIGAAVDVLVGKWEPLQFLRACEDYGTTLTSLVPTQVVDLVRGGLFAPPGLRAVVVGGSRLEQAIGQQARDLGWPVLQSYGMTEAGSQVATEPLEHLEAGFDPDRLEVLPHWKVDLVEGRLRIRGEALAAGYLEIGAMIQWRPIGGELLTRDCAALSSEGGPRYLRFEGRESQYLKINGELVHLGQLQATMQRIAMEHDLPSAFALVAVPDERSGQALVLRYEAARMDSAAAGQLRAAFDGAVRPFERVAKLERTSGPLVNEMGKALA